MSKFTDPEEFTRILRLELQEYGGLVDLLQKQQRGILRRDPDGLMEMNTSIELQSEVCNHLRARREEFVRAALHSFAASPEGGAATLAHCYPAPLRPLFQALIAEIERLVATIRQKARQNHLLLSRACQLTEELLNLARPGSATTVYHKRGKRFTGLPARGLQVQLQA